MKNRTQKFCSISLDHDAALKIESKVSHLNIAFDRYASKGIGSHELLRLLWHACSAI